MKITIWHLAIWWNGQELKFCKLLSFWLELDLCQFLSIEKKFKTQNSRLSDMSHLWRNISANFLKCPLHTNSKIHFPTRTTDIWCLDFNTVTMGKVLPKFLVMVFCYQNCSDPLWEKIILLIEKNFWNSRLKAENLQNFWDH